MSISEGEMVFRLFLAVLLCGLIGLERESRAQVAGLRTHILVGVGATLFTLISAYGFESFQEADPVIPRVDPTRVAAQIVAGIGFLGAGAIMRQGLNIRGLTTASALWIAAALGMAVGAGMYVASFVTTLIVLLSLVGFRQLRPWLLRRVRPDVVVLEVDTKRARQFGDIVEILSARHVDIEGMESDHEGSIHSYRFEILIPPAVEVPEMVEEIACLDGVVHAATQGIRV